MNIEQLKQSLAGTWQSIAVEVRSSAQKNADGSARPFYLSRLFTYQDDDTFSLTIINYADALGKAPLLQIYLAGHIEWKGEHLVAEGAQKADFSADTTYDITPLAQGFGDVLNKISSAGFNEWKVNETQSILQKSFPLFGLTKGQIFKEYDLMYLFQDMLFWGARHVDGRGFDSEENRPLNLQIPMMRKG